LRLEEEETSSLRQIKKKKSIMPKVPTEINKQRHYWYLHIGG
jgi:hypothetical protein